MRRVEADEQWSLIDPDRGARAARPVGRRSSTRAYRARRGRRAGRAPGHGPRALRPKMMRTLAQTGNGWMTFKDAANRTCNQTARRPGNVVHLSNLCTEIIEVTSDGETAVCNLGSVNLAAHLSTARAARRPIDWDEAARDRAHRGDRSSTASSTSTTTRAAEAAASNPRWRPVGLGRDGPAGRVLRAAAAVRLRRGARAVDPDRRGDLPRPRWRRSAELARAARPAPGVRRDPRGARRPAARPLGASTADPDRAVGARCASGSPSTGCATRCSSRSRRPRRSPRSPAATSASSRRCPTCSSARRCPASSSRSTPRWSRELKARGLWTRRGARGDQAGRGLGPGHRRDPRRRARAVPHRVGAAAAGADRPGRRPAAVHRPEPVAEPVPGAPDDRQALARCTSTPGRPG